MANKEKKDKQKEIIPFEGTADSVEGIRKICADYNDTRRVKTLWYLSQGLSLKEAGIKAGYSKGYADTGLYRAFNKGSKFRQAMEDFTKSIPAHMRNFCSFQALASRKALDKAMKRYAENPDLLISKPQLLKLIFNAANIVDDIPPPQTTFNIGNIQELMVQLGEQRRKELARGSVLDAEIDEESD